MSECLAHLDGRSGVIPGRNASTEPVGACKRCGAFACVGHGQRDPSGPEFVCVLCDVTLLSTSAAVGISGESLTDESAAVVAGMTARQSLEVIRPVGSVQEFLERRPAYPIAWLYREINDLRIEIIHGLPPDLARALSPEVEALLVTGLTLTLRLEMDPRVLPPGIAILKERLWG